MKTIKFNQLKKKLKNDQRPSFSTFSSDDTTKRFN